MSLHEMMLPEPDTEESRRLEVASGLEHKHPEPWVFHCTECSEPDCRMPKNEACYQKRAVRVLGHNVRCVVRCGQCSNEDTHKQGGWFCSQCNVSYCGAKPECRDKAREHARESGCGTLHGTGDGNPSPAIQLLELAFELCNDDD